ncbi:protease modulator HflC [Candidatus Liberibacter americanus]|uniref:Protein HflC n=1 Tax=Candidatus Liberibacter americanus str. Sao Paulo TaxID=1261131 RepID=U6B5A6_9HYPH|nr:protease modulator HflC [Candidatus Liberibacter americanus]AHA28095.1 HflC protein [Candidatus Liberibacter americanus str. Sao Paulo]EMS36058.1 hydrolase serine protease transmembrane protein [Candidatus Liberibacter americanus PW_SP]
MPQNRFLVIFLSIISCILGLLFFSLLIVDEREQVVVTRFGKINSVYTKPGIYFKAPFSFMNFDRVKYIQKQIMRVNIDNMRVQVSDGKFYEVDVMMNYRIIDPILFCRTVYCDRIVAESRLITRLDASLRRVYGLRHFEEALSKQRSSMVAEINDDLRIDSENLGIKVEDVRILRNNLTKEVSQQTYDRMKSERLAEAESIRARGREEAQKRISIADRDANNILSEARRYSEINYGQGEAERERILSNAFKKNPEFFEFYRSMKAYKDSLSSSNTLLILSPDSDFFKYFYAYQDKLKK